jgi:hypothetical protein
MPRLALASVLLLVLLFPSLVHAQASIAGVVTDASGAVLPGVTVEVSSPALIEKTRSTVTSATGQYEITSLVSGAYTVTFTLPGFNTARREGVELTGTFAAKIDAELRVGAVEETVTVRGESPVVDVQNATRQTVLGREVIDTIPAGRNPNMLAVLIPGVVTNNPIQDVGGAESRGGTQPGNTALAIHGGRTNDQIYMQNGVSAVSFDGAFINPLIPNPGATQEIVVDTAAASVEHYAGGVRINVIPRDGGNRFNGTFFGTWATGAFQSSNLDERLKAQGVASGEGIKRLADINPGFGGPIRRDRLWFYGSVRINRADSYAANAFYNLNANKAEVWTFEPHPGRRASNDVLIKDAQLRLTLQATPRNKVGLVWHEQVNCYCPAVLSAINSFETQSYKSLPIERSAAIDWTLPATNRLLVEAGAFYYRGTTNWNPWPGLAPGMISVQEQSTGLNYRSGDAAGERRYGSGPMAGLHSRAALHYLTGAHAIKVGFNDTSGGQSFSNMVLMPLKYRFNNGVPNRITQYAYGGGNDPLISKSTIDFNMGVFAQDKWTLRRLTTTYGVRFDLFKSSFPEQRVTPSLYAPTRTFVFPAQDNLAWKDVTPRVSAIYDLFGTGKTGLKVSLGKYLENMGTSQDMVSGPNPTRTLVTSAFRSWTDQDRDFVADCDLLNPNAQDNRATGGDICGALSDRNFGSVRAGAAYDPALMNGWGTRGFNWEFGAGVQHELFPRVALDVSYYRRWYGNFRVADNRTLSASDYDSFSITAPVDSRLPEGGGYRLDGVLDLKPDRFGLAADTLTTLARNYGKQTEYWQGLDLTIDARPGGGMLLQGGVSAGRTVTDNCDVVAKLPEARTSLFCHVDTASLGGTQVKFLGSYTVPRLDIQISAAYQNIPGAEIQANYNAPNAVVMPSLGRPLAGGAANIGVNLIRPGTMYGDRISQVDLRFAKLVSYAGTRATLHVDLYNAFNANPVLTQNFNFDAWLRPTNILQARFLKLGVQLNF